MGTRHRVRRLRSYLQTDEAVSALEYALVIGIMAVVVSAAVVAFSGEIRTALATLGAPVGNLTIGSTTKLE